MLNRSTYFQNYKSCITPMDKMENEQKNLFEALVSAYEFSVFDKNGSSG